MFTTPLRSRGFTLIELLVVIAIIGILSSIIVAGLNNARQSGRDAKRIADIKNLQLDLALYYNDKLAFPKSLDDLKTTGYASSLPKDPTTNASYFYAPFSATGGTIPNCGTTNIVTLYHLGAALETESSALNSDTDIFDGVGGNSVTVNGTTYHLCNGTGPNFDGASEDCSASGSFTEKCYDVTNF